MNLKFFELQDKINLLSHTFDNRNFFIGQIVKPVNQSTNFIFQRLRVSVFFL